MIRVMLVDDHALVRMGFRMLLTDAHVEVVAEADSGEQACRDYAHVKPDVPSSRKRICGGSVSRSSTTRAIMEWLLSTAIRSAPKSTNVSTALGSILARIVRAV